MLGGRPARWVAAAALLVLAPTGGADAEARLVAYGDSYVNPGAAAIRHGHAPWIALLDRPVRNLGHSGDGVDHTLLVVRRTAGQARDTVVVEVGLNDVRRFGTDAGHLAAFRTQYDEVLDLLAQARLVVVVPPLAVERWGPRGSEPALHLYRSVVLALAMEHPNVRVADPFVAWRPRTMLMPDQLHPNVMGRAVIAATVRRTLG